MFDWKSGRIWCFVLGVLLQVALTIYELQLCSVSSMSPSNILVFWLTTVFVSISLFVFCCRHPNIKNFIWYVIVIVSLKSTFFVAVGLPLSFESNEWKNNVAIRRRMVLDLVRNHIEVGSSRSAVQSILGLPDQVDFFADESVIEIYLIDNMGPGDAEPVDGTTLVIYYDLKSVVQKCSVFGQPFASKKR